MKVNADEYSRGLLFWTTPGPVWFRTRTSSDPGDAGDWSEVLTTPDGSKVSSPPLRFCALHALPQSTMALEPPYQVRWERLTDGGVVTTIFDNSLSSASTKLVHIPNYGVFHRLVVATPYLHWAEDATLRVDNVIIRLVDGSVTGEKVEPIEHVDVAEGTVSLTGHPSGSALVSGRFIEIVAPGEGASQAELVAYSILGLLALVVGAHAVGQVVFTESYEASPGQQLGRMQIPVPARFPKEAENSELGLVDLILPTLLQDGRMARTRLLALRWYERGIRSANLVDKLLAFFIGIEAIIAAYATENGPIPATTKRQSRLNELLRRLSKNLEDKNFLKQRTNQIVGASLGENFRFYGEQRSWDEKVIKLFQPIAETRSRIVHGDVTVAEPQIVHDAQDLLVRLLKLELGLPPKLAWEEIPQIHSVTLKYELLTNKSEAEPV